MQKHTITIEHDGVGKVTLILCNEHLSDMLQSTLPLDESVKMTIAPLALSEGAADRCQFKDCLR